MMERGNGGAMERGRAGVTLVELLVALVILGMMTARGALSGECHWRTQRASAPGTRR